MLPNKGDHVRIKQTGEEGEIINFNDCQERAKILFPNGCICKFKYSEFELISNYEN